MSVHLARIALEAVGDVADGSTVMIGGFGPAGQPVELIEVLLEQGAGDLVVSTNASNGEDTHPRVPGAQPGERGAAS